MSVDLREMFGRYAFRVGVEVTDRMPFYENEPADGLIHELTGAILFDKNTEEEKDHICVPVGTLHGLVVNVFEAQNAGCDLFDLFDAHSRELADVHAAVYQDGDEDLKEPFEYSYTAKIIYVTALRVDPAHRGNGLGLALMWKIMAAFNEALVVLEPVPLLSDPLHKDEQARAALRRYYGRLGFVPLGPRFWAEHTEYIQKGLQELFEGYMKDKLSAVASGAVKHVRGLQ
jgi:GNAT superfamily N-acetyltransferase